MKLPFRKVGITAWVLLVAVGSGLLTAAGVVLALDRMGQEYVQAKLAQLEVIERRLERARATAGTRYQVFYLGDSLSVGPQGFMHPEEWVPTRIENLVAREVGSRKAIEVIPLIGSGLSVFSYYFMADPIIAHAPDDVVVQFNLFWLSEDWHSELDRTVFGALLPLTWWPEALRLPLHLTTLTTDQWILYRGLYDLGLVAAWERVQGEQARMPAAYWKVAASLQESLGRPGGLDFREEHRRRYLNTQTGRDHRATRAAAARRIGTALGGVGPDNFALRMLDALLGRLAEAGIPVLVFVPPHNVEHLERLGLLDRAGLATSVARVESVVRRHGARFVDLHALLPNEGFRDYLDHYEDQPGNRSSVRIAARLAPEVARTYRAHEHTAR